MIDVMPLQPPFEEDVMHFHFIGQHKQLTVSMADGERIQALLSGAPEGRQIVLEAAPDNIHIRVHIGQ